MSAKASRHWPGSPTLPSVSGPNLDWASRPDATLPDDPIHAEWIELHRGPAFEEWVAFLRAELDRAADGLDRDRTDAVATRFVRAVDLELAFFDAAYG